MYGFTPRTMVVRAQVGEVPVHAATAYRRVQQDKWQHPAKGVFVPDSRPVHPVERALATVLSARGVASHSLAALLHDIDGAILSEPFVTIARNLRRRTIRTAYADLDGSEIVSPAFARLRYKMTP